MVQSIEGVPPIELQNDTEKMVDTINNIGIKGLKYPFIYRSVSFLSFQTSFIQPFLLSLDKLKKNHWPNDTDH